MFGNLHLRQTLENNVISINVVNCGRPPQFHVSLPKSAILPADGSDQVHTRVCLLPDCDHLFNKVLVWLLWSAPECDCCVHTFPNESHRGGKRSRVQFKWARQVWKHPKLPLFLKQKIQSFPHLRVNVLKVFTKPSFWNTTQFRTHFKPQLTTSPPHGLCLDSPWPRQPTPRPKLTTLTTFISNKTPLWGTCLHLTTMSVLCCPNSVSLPQCISNRPA